MRWFQVVVALSGGVVCEGVRLLLYALRTMPYEGQRPYPFPSSVTVNLWVVAPIVVIPLLAVFLRLVGADWRRSSGAAFVGYMSGFCTYHFTRFIVSLSSVSGIGNVFQRQEVQVLALIVGGGVLCIGLVVRNAAYPRWTVMALVGACLVGRIVAVNIVRTGTLESSRWSYQATYIITCTVYGLILVLAWRKPVDTFGTGAYRLGQQRDMGAAPERRLE